jgi:hypothetical protein
MNPDRITEHAKTAVAYYRALKAEGIENADAISLTSSYMLGVQRDDNEKEVWQR